MEVQIDPGDHILLTLRNLGIKQVISQDRDQDHGPAQLQAVIKLQNLDHKPQGPIDPNQQSLTDQRAQHLDPIDLVALALGKFL